VAIVALMVGGREMSKWVIVCVTTLASSVLAAAMLGVIGYRSVPRDALVAVTFGSQAQVTGWANPLSAFSTIPLTIILLLVVALSVRARERRTPVGGSRALYTIFAAIGLVLVFGQWTIFRHAV
jgi:hypothetical protein